jgi:hypothetical protein
VIDRLANKVAENKPGLTKANFGYDTYDFSYSESKPPFFITWIEIGLTVFRKWTGPGGNRNDLPRVSNRRC